jgi:hypothetical protein
MFFVQIPINRPRMPRIISRAALWSAATWRRFLMTLRLAWFVTALRRYIGSSQTICPTPGVLSDELNPCHPCPSMLIRGRTSRACEESRWNFFVSPLSSTARSRRRVVRRLLSAKYSVYAGWEEQPQPAPPGCGLSTSSTSLKPRSIAGLTSLKEYSIITTL